MNELGNLNIIGKSSVGGGRYHKVNIMGELSVLNDLEAAEIKVMGSLDSDHTVSCDKIRVLGNANAEQLQVKESGTVLGLLSSVTVEAEHFEVMGEVRCSDSFSCGDLKVNGVIEVEGLLNTERLCIKSRHVSRVKEMGGKRVKVSSSIAFVRSVLRAQIIEFDEVELECTQAELVRGRNVTIGENCSIDVVEYTDNLIQHPDAKIGEVRKI